MSELNGKLEPQDHGGQGGGAEKEVYVLSRADLVVLRKHADRIPFTEEDRHETRDVIMQTLRIAKSLRTKLSAVKAIAALERANIAEMTVHLKNQVNQVNLYPVAPSQQVNVQVNNQIVVNPDKTKFLEKAKEYDEATNPEPLNGSAES